MSYSHEQEDLTQNTVPYCTNNCGFFANMGCSGLCSKCHREKAIKEGKNLQSSVEPAKASTSAISEAIPPISSNVSIPGSPKSFESSEPSTTSLAISPPEAKVVNRCFMCKKRVGLTGFKCKCDNLFCSAHRMAEYHSCTYDYKGAQRQRIADCNPVVQASKVQKI
mmetsp:Transcript_19699/g.35533  ORF Transcript_19699/g.35533 Transcript_19699/m.35533 type:complete len:166 (-) Transcript_19699:327-824(-)